MRVDRVPSFLPPCPMSRAGLLQSTYFKGCKHLPRECGIWVNDRAELSLRAGLAPQGQMGPSLGG